jgi:hypothetical protein
VCAVCCVLSLRCGVSGPTELLYLRYSFRSSPALTLYFYVPEAGPDPLSYTRELNTHHTILLQQPMDLRTPQAGKGWAV